MGLTDEHYQSMRRHFFNLLGSKCLHCDFNDYEKIHFHHIKPNEHLINGKNHTGRGREKRVWELFQAFSENNLMLLCPRCHFNIENNFGDKNKV